MKYQRKLAGEGGIADQRVKSRAHFKSANDGRKKWIQHVRATLKNACHEGRCPYCEDNTASHIDHFKPIDIDPRTTFVWRNFVYACAVCNGKKGEKWTVFDHAMGATHRALTSQMTTLPDLSLVPVLINPRWEDPSDFFEIDLIGTGGLSILPPAGSREAIKAEHTRSMFELNGSDLPKHRRRAYRNFVARLENYVAMNRSGNDVEIARRRYLVLEQDHLGVWREMQRRHLDIPELKRLFALAPEALLW